MNTLSTIARCSKFAYCPFREIHTWGNFSDSGVNITELTWAFHIHKEGIWALDETLEFVFPQLVRLCGVEQVFGELQAKTWKIPKQSVHTEHADLKSEIRKTTTFYAPNCLSFDKRVRLESLFHVD
jgi:hypothetical protein